MYPCPSCNRSSFGLAAKLWSWPALPAKCRECGKLCFTPSSPDGVLLVVNTVLLTLAGFFASLWHSPLPLAIGCAVAVALWMLRLHIQPLVALSPEQVAAARMAEGFWVIVLLVLSALR
jgi:hypothetical protein